MSCLSSTLQKDAVEALSCLALVLNFLFCAVPRRESLLRHTAQCTIVWYAITRKRTTKVAAIPLQNAVDATRHRWRWPVNGAPNIFG